VATAGSVASIFGELYPKVMVSTTSPSYTLTIANSVSPSYSLKVMSVVALLFFPLVLIYQGWTYHIFKRRLGGPRLEATGTAPGGPDRGDQAASAPTAPGDGPRETARPS
jgi:cytochrome bd ubiquinol oxidase subunit II